MSIAIAKLLREFVYNGVNLADPGPTFTPDVVRDLYSAQYPELTTAAIDGPEYSGDFEPTSPLYLGIEMQEENIFDIGEKVAQLGPEANRAAIQDVARYVTVDLERIAGVNVAIDTAVDAYNRELRAAGIRTVGVSHGTVNGCIPTTPVTMDHRSEFVEKYIVTDRSSSSHILIDSMQLSVRSDGYGVIALKHGDITEPHRVFCDISAAHWENWITTPDDGAQYNLISCQDEWGVRWHLVHAIPGAK